MAMVKPIGISIPAFNATQDYIFQFKSSGGSQVVKNKITIKDNTTNGIVYTNEIESYEYKQTVPANTLTNGKYYNFTFITYDKSGNASEESNPISFYCYTTPELSFTNLTQDYIIETSNYTFQFTYNQIEGELLDYLIVSLYDSNNNLISSSGQILGQEELPNNLSYSFNGLIDDETYFIQINGATINSTVISTEKIRFSVNYYYPELFNVLDVSNNCENGYIHITNNTVLIDGECNPSEPIYLDEKKIVLENYEDYVKFNKGYYIGDTFTIEIWMNPVLTGNILKLFGSDENKYIETKLVKEIPYKETEYKYAVEVKYIENGTEKIYKFSEYIDLINNLSDIIVWIRKTKEDIIVKLVETSHTDNVLNTNEESNVFTNRISNLEIKQINVENYGFLVWNEPSDIVYNEDTNMFWNEEPLAWDSNTLLKTAKERIPVYEGYNLGNITTTILRNGIFDNINITKDIISEFNTELPSWNYDTILNCDFNGNIYAGNTELTLEQISAVKIKVRKKGSFDWVTLYEIPITKYEDLTFTRDNYFSPNNEIVECALVPILTGNIEGSYNTNEVKSEFKDCFITDGKQSFKLYSGVSYSSNSVVKPFGILQPYGSKYPTIITNSTINYQILIVTGNLLGYDFDNYNLLNDSSIIQEQEDFIEFMYNGKPKIYKDWNGKILLGTLSSQLSFSYSTTGMRVPSVTFTLTEQGKYNIQEDLYNNGLTGVVS